MNDQQRRKKFHSVVPGWQELLTAAMLQRDPVRQRQFLYAAKAAIDDRLQECNWITGVREKNGKR